MQTQIIVDVVLGQINSRWRWLTTVGGDTEWPKTFLRALCGDHRHQSRISIL